MSAEKDLGDAIQGHAPLVAIVGQAVYLDEVPSDQAKPYVVYSRQTTRVERNLLGDIIDRRDIFDVQCVGTSRAQSLQIRALVEDAVVLAGHPPPEMPADYDPATDAEIESVTVEWWT